MNKKSQNETLNEDSDKVVADEFAEAWTLTDKTGYIHLIVNPKYKERNVRRDDSLCRDTLWARLIV